MTIAYIFRTEMAATYPLATMILPQLEQGIHGATVIGMMFFDDNLYCLRKGDPIGSDSPQSLPIKESCSWCATNARYAGI